MNALFDPSLLVVRKMTTKDQAFFPEAITMLNRTQGQNLFGPNYLDVRTARTTNFVAAAFYQDALIALGVAEILEQFDYYLPFVPAIAEELADKKVGSMATLSVHEDFQGKSIGQKLSTLRLAWLVEQKCSVVLGVSWVSGLAHTSNRVFEKLGFTALNRVEGFYHHSSLDNPFICPGCGEPPCSCAAILYRREL